MGLTEVWEAAIRWDVSPLGISQFVSEKIDMLQIQKLIF